MDDPLARLSRPRTPYYAPPLGGSAYDQFFDLTPTPKNVGEVLHPGDEGPTVIELLEQECDVFQSATEKRALEAFRLGTDKKLEPDDRFEHLAQAATLLEAVERADSKTVIAPLLIMHIALEQRQIERASRELAEAIRRKPTLFADPVDLTPYFQDPSLLTEQFRQNMLVSEQNPLNVGAAVLQAYCCFMLGDNQRANDALDRMAALNQEGPQKEDIRTIGYALRYAMQ